MLKAGRLCVNIMRVRQRMDIVKNCQIPVVVSDAGAVVRVMLNNDVDFLKR